MLRLAGERDVSGWGLVRNGFDDLGGAFSSGLWQPLVIVLGGGVLFLLGLAAVVAGALAPLRRRSSALLVSLAVTAAVLVPLIDAKWQLGFFGPGFWCAIAVAVLGLLGSLKAVLRDPGPQRATADGPVRRRGRRARGRTAPRAPGRSARR